MGDIRPQVHTHHCICSNLLLATTFDFDKRRTLDRAMILPCPRDASTSGTTDDALDGELDGGQAGHTATTVLMSTPSSTMQPILVRSDEGIEKRYPFRCDRCKLVFGYHLDWAQYSQGSKKTGRRQDVLYLLDGATIETGDMERG